MNQGTTIASLRSALAAAQEHAQAAEESYNSAPADDDDAHVLAASYAADEAVDVARAALVEALTDSDEPRTWRLIEDGQHYDTIEASSADEALAIARGNVDASNYESEALTTMWIDVEVRCEETDEHARATVTCEPDEPECPHHTKHDWQSPHEILGGLEENPGVWGHGGGVVITEVCMHCGCSRVTDTWAQRTDTGEQGLESVTYEPGKYADEVAAVDEDAA